jgi:light-regulated signal transduction histidine kinase (bacteriophytochrome)/CheY-like chemotaxis protein
LWGLIACHHNEPRLPSFVMRSAAELLGQLYALTLESRLRQADTSEDLRARELAERMITDIAADPSLLANSVWLQDAMRVMIDCDGIAVTSNNDVSVSGSVPTEREIKSLAGKMSSAPANAVVVTDHLASLLPGSGNLRRRAAGMLAIPLSRVPRDYIMLFRRELIHEVKWGGNPEKPASLTDDGLRMSPRKSFASFSTLVRERSRPFSGIERRVAEAIRVDLIEVILRLSDEAHKERKRAFEQQQLLIAELNHRVRNILALIRGLISQTGRVALDVGDYIESLSGRVQALARAHNQITQQNWGPAAIFSLFDDEISAFVPPKSERFVIDGPNMFLQPQAFTTMALVIHELVTNSSKYGALSQNGRVAVAVEHRVGIGLYLKWRESGGPPVSPPVRRGFGSAIIERSVPFELQGTAEIRYNSTGLEADFFIPERHLWVEAAPDARAGTSQQSVDIAGLRDRPRDLPLSGAYVLLLEDNMIVALEAEQLLRDFGAHKIWTASTVAEAAQIAERERIEFAMLDINVGLESSLDFATRFRADKTPHIFASGYGEEFDLGERHFGTIIAKKPYVREQLRQAICSALRSETD